MKAEIFFLVFVVSISCNNPEQGKIEYGSNEEAGKYVEVNDIKIYYEIYGEGEPLLLLHGNGGSILSFEFQIPELSKYFKVIAVDSRAQGKSTDSEKEITYALMASDMNELIDNLQLESVYIAGWSDGGNIGLELAYAHPEKVKKLVVYGANYSWKDFLAAPDDTQMDPDDPIFEKTGPVIQKSLSGYKKISPGIQKKLAVLMEKYPDFTLEQLNQIEVPVLVVAGDHDMIRPDHTLTLFTSLPHAQLFIVPGASHMAPIEQPELINSETIKFLNTPYRDLNGYYFMSLMQ
jgi:pimeloyl-ACP methyl ester carboxylesterase